MKYHFTDTDYYKFTMGQFVFHNFPTVHAKHEFINRDENCVLHLYLEEIKDAIKDFCNVHITKDEISFLKSQGIFKDSYLEFLKLLKLNYDFVNIGIKNDRFFLEINGPFYLTIYFEKILSIISEIYCRHTFNYPNIYNAKNNLFHKLNNISDNIECWGDFKFADFGTRRRFSFEWHEKVIQTILKHKTRNCFVGTSNVYFAKEFGIKPIGTQAHELFQMGQALVHPRESQKFILQKWIEEYQGNVGIALTDTINTKAFLKDFNLLFAKVYDGVRQDSGDPITFGEQILFHYKKLGITSKTKTIVFSDGLDFNTAIILHNTFKDDIHTSFGIGTNLTNDLDGVKAPNIVMKLSEINGQPVAKISDSPGKEFCKSDIFLKYLKEIFE